MKIDLRDTTFIIPVHFDHEDRRENLQLSLKQLNTHFATNIIIGEQGSDEFSGMGVEYVKFDCVKFHRTRMLNDLTKLAKTKFVVNYDCDVLLPPLNLFMAIHRLRNGVDFCYPYDGRFARVPRIYYEEVDSFNDVGVLAGRNYRGITEEETKSFGGAVAYNRQSFFNAGGENENFVSWSGEDWERVHRFKLLGFKVERITGILYHIDHWTGVNSSTANPDYESSMAELRKVQKMSKAKLAEYVSGWDLFKKFGAKQNP